MPDLLGLMAPLEFRGDPVARVVAMVLIVALLVIAVVVAVTAGPLPDRVVSAAFVIGGALGVFALMLRPALRIIDGEVDVVGPVGRVRFPLSDLQRASGARFLVLHRRSGEDVRVFAVQNANVTLIRGRSGRTQRVAAEINELLASSNQRS